MTPPPKKKQKKHYAHNPPPAPHLNIYPLAPDFHAIHPILPHLLLYLGARAERQVCLVVCIAQQGPAHGLDAWQPAEVGTPIEGKVGVVREQEGDAEVAGVEEGGEGEEPGRGYVEDVRLELLDHPPPPSLPVEREQDLMSDTTRVFVADKAQKKKRNKMNTGKREGRRIHTKEGLQGRGKGKGKGVGMRGLLLPKTTTGDQEAPRLKRSAY